MSISPASSPQTPFTAAPPLAADETRASGVTWSAILAGAVIAASVTLILTGLGAGLGLTTVSPWKEAPSATTFTIVAGIWLIVTQWLSAGLGGYIAGRLRTRWASAHTDEVFFRDTAHGLIVWALAILAGAVLLVAAGSSALGGGARLAAGATSGLSGAASSYDADLLLRRASPETGQSPDADQRGEVLRIVARDLAAGEMKESDRDYLVQIVAARTGLSQPEAQKRVDEISNQVKQAADAARKSAAGFSLFGALSMLIGAFIAAAAAALGGRQRDQQR